MEREHSAERQIDLKNLSTVSEKTPGGHLKDQGLLRNLGKFAEQKSKISGFERVFGGDLIFPSSPPGSCWIPISHHLRPEWVLGWAQAATAYCTNSLQRLPHIVPAAAGSCNRGEEEADRKEDRGEIKQSPPCSQAKQGTSGRHTASSSPRKTC